MTASYSRPSAAVSSKPRLPQSQPFLLSPDTGRAGSPFKRTLILGYGNPDRQDDGVAMHILAGLARALDLPFDPALTEVIDPAAPIALLFALQLMPEHAETAAAYERICFVDAHTGSVPADLNIQAVAPVYTTSPLTHHMTPAACLSIVATLSGQAPAAILVSVRGYAFQFTPELSAPTQALADEAVTRILAWLQDGNPAA